MISLMLPGYTVNTSQIQDFRLFFSVLPLLPITVLALSYYPAVNDRQKSEFLSFFATIDSLHSINAYSSLLFWSEKYLLGKCFDRSDCGSDYVYYIERRGLPNRRCS
ncbi:hypothetical protein [Chryseobacterium indoltheticum]|uniref:hypothetical protein n=1 Tax=Chryseobacterium indoltheticum TaxID=254 RepID=UPI003F492ACB